MSAVWFVVQKRKMKQLSANIIGFWDKKTNYDPISKGDKIIYYCGGKEIGDGYRVGNIEGIFEVTEGGKNIDNTISSVKIYGKPLIWQFKIKLVAQMIINKKYLNNYQKRLRFYKQWKGNKWGGGNVQIFQSSSLDIKILEGILNSHWNKSTQCLP